MYNPSRRPPIASPTTSSAPPSPYISAVSIKVMPRSMPSLSAAISRWRSPGCSPIRQVPCPSTGIEAPDGNPVVLIDMPILPFRSSSVDVYHQSTAHLAVENVSGGGDRIAESDLARYRIELRAI